MRPCKAHFVTSCQQLLALGAVLAVLTPAASVVSLDVVETPGSATAPTPPATGTSPAPATGGAGDAPDRSRTYDQPVTEVEVPVEPVEAEVTEVPITPEQEPPAEPRAGDGEPSRERGVARTTERLGRTTVVSEPQHVTGYGAVGVTWSHEEQVADDRIRLEVRTATDGDWSGWTALEYHDEHAPDVGEESEGTRPGTDPLLVGEVDRVQLRAVARDGLPEDMSLAVVAPGRPSATRTERVTAPASTAPEAPEPSAPTGDGEDEDALALQAATSKAPQPTIITRRQWGANERLRDGSPSYGTISAGFVHHTVNANGYERRDVAGIVRSIYAYHTQSRGWSDIGYNFLVDRFGRIWEGRYGGIARPVVGAHTLGYNEDSFAMSAIGNFDTAHPPEAMLKAYGRLFAWKLGLHGIRPTDMSRSVSGDSFAAINGHRDAGSTACPGRYLYARLPAIRRYAAAATQAAEPAPLTLRQVDSDQAGSEYPDLVVRRASDGRGLVVPTGGLTAFTSPATLARSGWGSRTFLTVPDLTGDRRVDLVTFDDRGRMEVRAGRSGGGFGGVSRIVSGFEGHAKVAATGDLDGDGRADFVARSEGTLVSFLQNARGGFRAVSRSTSLSGYRQLVGAGDVTGDGRPDLWARDSDGRLWLHQGLGEGRFADRQAVAGDHTDLDWLAGGVDYTRDGVPDLVARTDDDDLVLLPSLGNGELGRALGPLRDARGLRMISGAGQLTGGSAPDLVAARSDGALVVLPNRGTYDLGRPIDTGRSFARGDRILNAGDWDGDGDGDVLLRRRVGSVWLYRGRGTGRLAAPVQIGSRLFADVNRLRVVADLTGDDRHDLVGRLGGDWVLWPGTREAGLGQRRVVDVAGSSSDADTTAYDWSVRVSDLRGRGGADLLARDGSGGLHRLDGTADGYGAPRYLGQARGYDLAG